MGSGPGIYLNIVRFSLGDIRDSEVREAKVRSFGHMQRWDILYKIMFELRKKRGRPQRRFIWM